MHTRCTTRCGIVPCPPCSVPTAVQLACGHMQTVTCARSVDIEILVCTTLVDKKLLCGHRAAVKCSSDVDSKTCHQICGGIVDCSHSTCSKRCNECKNQKNAFDPSHHVPHSCERLRHCSHPCGGDCLLHSDPIVKCGGDSVCGRGCRRTMCTLRLSTFL